MTVKIGKDGKYYTEDHSTSTYDPAKAKLERTKRELRDMIAGNTKFHDDPYENINPKPLSAEEEEELRQMVEILEESSYGHGGPIY